MTNEQTPTTTIPPESDTSLRPPPGTRMPPVQSPKILAREPHFGGNLTTLPPTIFLKSGKQSSGDLLSLPQDQQDNIRRAAHMLHENAKQCSVYTAADVSITNIENAMGVLVRNGATVADVLKENMPSESNLRCPPTAKGPDTDKGR